MFSNLTKSRIKSFYIGHKMFLKYKTFSPKSQKGGTPPTLSGSDWLSEVFASGSDKNGKNTGQGST